MKLFLSNFVNLPAKQHIIFVYCVQPKFFSHDKV